MKSSLIAVVLCGSLAGASAGVSAGEKPDRPKKSQENAEQREEAQRRSLEEIFALKDTDNSGALSREELKQRVPKKKKDGKGAGKEGDDADFDAFADDADLAKGELKSIFDEADQDGSNDLDFSEWVLFRQLRRTTVFHHIDANADGEITLKEYRKWKNRRLAKKELDEDELEERHQRLKKHFSRLDTDDDGVVTLDEFLSGRWRR